MVSSGDIWFLKKNGTSAEHANMVNALNIQRWARSHLIQRKGDECRTCWLCECTHPGMVNTYSYGTDKKPGWIFLFIKKHPWSLIRKSVWGKKKRKKSLSSLPGAIRIFFYLGVSWPLIGYKHTKPFKNCCHKYNMFACI
jgi:hypothetical protein